MNIKTAIFLTVIGFSSSSVSDNSPYTSPTIPYNSPYPTRVKRDVIRDLLNRVNNVAAANLVNRPTPGPAPEPMNDKPTPGGRPELNDDHPEPTGDAKVEIPGIDFIGNGRVAQPTPKADVDFGVGFLGPKDSTTPGSM